MDFAMALQKLNDALMKGYGFYDGKRIESGLWDFYGFRVIATLESGNFTVHCGVKEDDNRIFTPLAFKKALSGLKDSDMGLVIRYVNDWIVYTPLFNKTHPYHIDPSERHRFITKRSP
ncbi:MAG: hypothetical protein FWC26_03900 [Fibromonadales bacterium]|nr:hypothetical protein [Fibromonadales bacterium]